MSTTDQNPEQTSSSFHLVLASASPSRADVLARAHIPFMTMVSDVDEDAVGSELNDPSPAELASELARAKAASVVSTLMIDEDMQEPGEESDVVEPDLVVLGCDSVFEFEGHSYGKPHDAATAIQRWQAQAGKSGVLHSGHWLIQVPSEPGQFPEKIAHRTVSSKVSFANASQQQIEDYVATGEPLPCAGAFTLEGRGSALVTGVHGDPNAVLGLSVNALNEMLNELGHNITSVWNS